MQRRTLLKIGATAPLVVSIPSIASAQEDVDLRSISTDYFRALPETKAERNSTVVECANALCSARKAVSEEVLDAVVNSGDSASDVVRRLQFGIQILNEYNITNKIDESMIETGRRNLSEYDRYLPLIGSFNNLCDAACAVETPDPDSEAVKDFLFAAAAFGLEVALWTIGTPYKMAWRGTRFISNRTFLRFARHGCSGCIALVMSELHWAIRGAVYGEVVTANKVKFVSTQIDNLRTESQEIGYDVDLDYDDEEIRALIESGNESDMDDDGGGAVGMFPQEQEGPVERFIPDISIEVPSASELLRDILS